MGDHLKRYVAPDSWSIARKVNTFVIKPSPGPHNANAMPIAVWLRDHMGFARNQKEVRQILQQRDVIVNGHVCRHPAMGIGIFDIISLPKMGRYYRILRDKKGRHKTIEIDETAAQSRLSKIVNKTLVKGGKVQLNLRDGSNVLADSSYATRDSVVLSLKEDNFNSIIDHFPFLEGNVAMVIGGKHSGVVARIKEILPVPGSVSNRVILENESLGTTFETIDDYVVMVGREKPALETWGIEE
ncbi:MAG: 30S ribosomal protein S4e [Methanospirillaceae archaeon]|nr:30S ribosomal protein S4e [Methanospirillaceae archaeon]